MNAIVTLLWISWAISASLLEGLMIDRGLVQLHETDQLFLTQSAIGA